MSAPSRPPSKEGGSFGIRLSLAARAAGFTSILDLAEAAGISKESMRKYRTGDRMPTAPILIELARALGVTPGWLLGASARDEARGVLRASEIEARMRASATPSGTGGGKGSPDGAAGAGEVLTS